MTCLRPVGHIGRDAEASERIQIPGRRFQRLGQAPIRFQAPGQVSGIVVDALRPGVVELRKTRGTRCPDREPVVVVMATEQGEANAVLPSQATITAAAATLVGEPVGRKVMVVVLMATTIPMSPRATTTGEPITGTTTIPGLVTETMGPRPAGVGTTAAETRAVLNRAATPVESQGQARGALDRDNEDPDATPVPECLKEDQDERSAVQVV